MPTDDGRPTGQASSPDASKVRRAVVITTQFKKDFRREEKGRHRASLRADLQAAVDLLAEDVPLPHHMVDHALTGNWKSHRDCHIKPDLVLIYRKPPTVKGRRPAADERPTLHLVRLGSHSELGL